MTKPPKEHTFPPTAQTRLEHRASQAGAASWSHACVWGGPTCCMWPSTFFLQSNTPLPSSE